MQSVLVWDWPLRIFHWSLVLCVLGSYLTAEYGWLSMQWHFYFGYAILVLLGFRIIWGFVGPKHARFAEFLTGPRRLFAYLRTGEATAGHNPTGAVATLVLLGALAVQSISGLFNSDEIQWFGPLSEKVSGDWMEFAADVHERFDGLLLAVIVVHISAAIGYLLFKKQNLILPMLTGRKQLPDASEAIAEHRFVRALLALGASCAVVWAIIRFFPSF